MELFRIIKSDGKKAMSDFGGRAVSAFIIILLFGMGINLFQSFLHFFLSGAESALYDFYVLYDVNPKTLAVTGAAALLWFFVMPALGTGHKKLNLAFAEGRNESVALIFEMFSSPKKYFGTLVFAFAKALRLLFTFAFAALPGGALFFVTEKFLPESAGLPGILRTSLFLISVFLLALCFFIGIIFIQRWSLADYYFASGRGPLESFSLSVKATKGRLTDIIAFRCSFVGWVPLSLLILPMLWSVPFYALSCGIYFRYLMECRERALAEIPEIEIEEEPGKEEPMPEE